MTDVEKKIRAIHNSLRVLRQLKLEGEYKKRTGKWSPEEEIELTKVIECITRGERLLGIKP